MACTLGISFTFTITPSEDPQYEVHDFAISSSLKRSRCPGGAVLAAYKQLAKAKAVIQAAKSTTDVAMREELMALHWLLQVHVSNAWFVCRVVSSRNPRVRHMGCIIRPLDWVPFAGPGLLNSA